MFVEIQVTGRSHLARVCKKKPEKNVGHKINQLEDDDSDDIDRIIWSGGFV